MTDFTFAPATKEAAKARVAFAGPSGSGKTFTALVTAHSLAAGGRVAVIDTERASASKYADEFNFDTLQMHAYDPRDLVKALAAASQHGYDVVVVDSLSHFWMGTGGMLEQVDNAAKRSYGGNSFGGWKEARPMERAMVDALLAYPGHVIVTMRTKTEWVIQENERGRKEPKKIGTKPEQRDGIEYEFDICGDLDLEHTLVISKSRARPLADAVIRRPDEKFGQQILAWLGSGATPAVKISDYVDAANSPTATLAELMELYRTVENRGMLGAAVMDGTGEAVSLGDLIKAKGRDARNREQAAAVVTEQVNNAVTELDGKQSKHIHTLLGKLGVSERADKLQRLSEIVGRDLASSQELTHDEAKLVIEELQQATKRDAAEVAQ